MKYKEIFKSWWFWVILLILVAFNSYFVYQDYGTISLIEIIGAFIFDFIIWTAIASFFWLWIQILSKTFNRKEKT